MWYGAVWLYGALWQYSSMVQYVAVLCGIGWYGTVC